MASLIHIAEIAALLTAAYILGWAIGYAARRLTAAKPAVAAIPASRLAAATGEAPDALVKAPIIVPVANDPPPPVPQPAAPVLVEPAPVVAPSPAPVAEPVIEVVPEIKPVVIAAVAELPPLLPEPTEPAPSPGPEPLPESEPAAPFTAAPALRPGIAWAGEIKGREAARFELPIVAEPEPVAVARVEPPPVEPPPVEVPAPTPEPEPVAVEEPIRAPELEPAAVEPTPEPIAPEPPPSEPEPAAAPPPPPIVHDEDAAMRAIEGGWSRVRARAMPGSPELADVGAAVAAAQTAVEQVLARAGIDPQASPHTGKPRGPAAAARRRQGQSQADQRLGRVG